MDPSNQPVSPDNSAPEQPLPEAPTPDQQPPSSPVVAVPGVQPPVTSFNQPASSSSKKTLITILAVVIILAILGGIGFALAAKKKPANQNTNAVAPASTTTQAPSSNPAPGTSTIAGYVPLEKLCYTLQVPKDNDAGSENSCVFAASFGAAKTTSMTVAVFTKNGQGLDANVADLKAKEVKLGSTLTSEESLKIGGLDAKKIVFKEPGQYGLTTAHFLVATSKYKVDNVPVTGFEIIAAAYDKTENKTIIDSILSSWQWK